PAPARSAGTNPALLAARDALYREWVAADPAASADEPLMRLPLTMLSPLDLPFLAPHFVDEVLDGARADDTSRAALRRDRRDPQLHTTLDLNLQRLVERHARAYVARNKKFGIKNVAALLVDARGMEVKALLGSADFNDASIAGQVNGAQAKR